MMQRHPFNISKIIALAAAALAVVLVFSPLHSDAFQSPKRRSNHRTVKSHQLLSHHQRISRKVATINRRRSATAAITTALSLSMVSEEQEQMTEQDRKDLWKKISQLEREAIIKLSKADTSDEANDSSSTATTTTAATTAAVTAERYEAYKLLAASVQLKQSDPFMRLCAQLSAAKGDAAQEQQLLQQMSAAKLPPHIAALAQQLPASSFTTSTTTATATSTGDASTQSPSSTSRSSGMNLDYPSTTAAAASEGEVEMEEVDPGSTFSDTVTEKVRVKVNAFFDPEKSDPSNGKYMFWYKVVIFNEGPEAVQVVARMWEIDKCKGDREVVRGSGVMSSQPIIPPGDYFAYQSVCPLKVFPPKGKRILGSMTGAYTMCKGNMGQHNFSVKIGKFNLILPEEISSSSSENSSGNSNSSGEGAI